MVTIANDKPSMKDLLSRPEAEITTVLGGIYEHSVWVAEELVKNDCKKLDTVTALAASMKAIVDGASNERKLELLCAHPDLCEKVGIFDKLTKASQEEQSRAGLQSLTDEELERFTICNTEYRSKFGFPFILAVRNASKFTVLSALEGRVSNSVETEFVQAIVQVHKIAWMRLLTIINTDDAKGFLTCHVLDTANGCPGKGSAAVSPTCQYNDTVFFFLTTTIVHAAAKMRVHLHRLSPPESATFVGAFVTNDEGRLADGPALKGGKEFTLGTYQWTFFVADYFASKGTFVSGTPFLDEVPLRFGIDNPDDHYHVPLLVSPWSFSSYRGS